MITLGEQPWWGFVEKDLTVFKSNKEKLTSSVGEKTFTSQQYFYRCKSSDGLWQTAAGCPPEWWALQVIQSDAVSRGHNSGSCWTEPVFVENLTVISSVGTGGWAQAPASHQFHHKGKQTDSLCPTGNCKSLRFVALTKLSPYPPTPKGNYLSIN